MRPSDRALRAALARTRALSTAPRLDPSTFATIRDRIAAASGVAFDESSRFIVERRLHARLRALRLDDFETYARRLAHGPDAEAELARLLEAVTVRETYFFRAPAQLEAFRDEVLPALAEENAAARRLRVWSAGCATGEEPYTVAILVRESGLFDGWDVEILGTDLVPAALARARRGLYRDASLRSTPDDVRRRYFRREGSGWRLDEGVRGAVVFAADNLVGPPRAPETERAPFDAIFCRNVLIYHGEPSRLRILGRLHDCLRDGGRLLLGSAESLIELDTPFRLEHAGRDVVYVR